MDFPTALRYLMAGRTIRRESSPTDQYRIGTIHEYIPPSARRHRRDGPAIFWLRNDKPQWKPTIAMFHGSDVIAEDWELVE